MTEINKRTKEHRGRTLSLAVELRDAFTGNHPSGSPEVSLKVSYKSPAKNPSDFYVFVDLEPEAVTLQVEDGDRYFDVEQRVILPHGDPDDAGPEDVVVDDPYNPVTIEMTPTPSFKFPKTSTHIRGMVTNVDDDPVAGAEVSIPEFDLTTRTTEDGEYAVLLPITSKDVVKTNGKKMVRVNGDGRRKSDNGSAISNGNYNGDDGNDPTLEVSHPDFGSSSERVEVESGGRTVHYVTLE